MDREVQGEMEWIALDRKRGCVEPLSCVVGNVADEEVVEVSGVRGKVIVGVTRVFVFLLLFLFVLLLFAFLSVSDFEVDGPQTLSVSRMLGASVALECEQYKRAKARTETTPLDATRCQCPRGHLSKRRLSV